jgi:pimeloyl-ACP methyl ester carboxylesterase
MLAATFLASPIAAQTAAERLDLPAPDAREGETLSKNGAEIFYSSSGDGDAIVLLHGYPLSGALFERVRDSLDDTHRVITIDHRGYGQSSTPEPVESVSTYAEDALAVLDSIGVDQAVIGGMSMGGPILFEMYRQNPDVFSGAILIDTNHMPAGEIEQGIWNGTLDALNNASDVGAIIPFLMPNMLTGETRLVSAPAQVDYLTAAIEQASVDGALGGAKVLRDRPDSTETLGSMDIPVLVVVGREDTLYPVAISQAMADAAPQGELAVIPGAAHAAVFERPDAVAEAIQNWLGKM